MKSKQKWIPDPKEAIAVQRSLAADVQPKTPAHFSPHLVAGVDVSCNRFSPVLHAGVVVLDLQTRRIVDSASAVMTATFPYIPGLLSFREAPAILRAWEQLRTKPDLVFVDGNGIAHPRRLGIAAHLGITWKLPTIGCAKSRLIGQHRTPGMRRGASVRLVHEGEIVGAVVRTRDRVAPVYVSVGNLIGLDDARRWILKTTDGYRLPLPIRLAHDFVNQVRRDSQNGTSQA